LQESLHGSNHLFDEFAEPADCPVTGNPFNCREAFNIGKRWRLQWIYPLQSLPSFVFVLGGATGFQRLRDSDRAKAFLGGAGPAAAGAILGTAVPLTRALTEWWQYAVLAGAAVLVLVLRRGVVPTLLLAGAVGAVIALAGGSLPG